MLQNIRDKTQGWITRVVVGLVCASFILWGVHSFSQWTGGANGAVASVNGKDIMPQEFNAALQRLVQQQQAQLGANFQLTDQIQASLKQAALQQLIASKALVAAAQKRDLRYTAAQVGRVIAGISAFQDNGHFSSQKFEQNLSALGYSETEFFDNIRNAMLINQLRVGVVGSSFALPWEASEALQLVNQKRDIVYTIVPAKNFENTASVSDSAIQQYYAAHQDQFTTPQTVVLQYLELSMTEQAASQAFSDALDKLTNLTYTNPQSLAPAAKALGLTVQTSEAFTPAQGKGLFANPAIKQAILSKDVLSGNNSNVINLDDQHAVVIRILSQHPSQVKALSKVKTDIATLLKAQQADNAAANAAQNMVSAVMAGKSLSMVAQEKQQSIHASSNIGRYAKGTDEAINNAAFQLPRPSQQASVGMFQLPSKDYVVIQVTKVSSPAAQAIQPVQQRVMNEQIANAYAQLEYELYVSSVLNDAKIHVYGEKSQ